MIQIHVKNISKTYKTYFKNDNLLTSFKGLFNRTYRTVEAVKDIHFTVKSGEILGLIGPNGAGKTTIIKMVSGIVKPDGGDILILNEAPFKKSKSYRKNVALVMGQKGQLDRDLTIMDSIRLYAKIYSIDKKEAIERTFSMAEELNLERKDLYKQVRQLSLGQKMKGELILSFLHLPKIIFLDEPTLGLDFSTQKSIRNYLKSYKDKYNPSIILTSHYINDIEDLCENIYIIDRGKQLYYGSIFELKSKTRESKKVIFSATPEAIGGIEKISEFIVKKQDGMYMINFKEEEMSKIIHILSSINGISDINFSEDSLDVIIEDLYKELNQSNV